MAPKYTRPTRYVPAGKPKPKPKRGKLGRFVARIRRKR